MNNAPCLLADIGGTHARFALSDAASVRDVLQLKCADFPSLELAVDHYLRTVGEYSRRHLPLLHLCPVIRSA